MKRTCLALLCLPLVLAACQDAASPAGSGNGAALREAAARAPLLGEAVRTAQFCGFPLSLAAQDRAARIEAVVIEMHRRDGGQPAVDRFLRSLQPPRIEPRNRAGWCASHRQDFDRLHRFLASEEGEALASRAEAASR